MILMMEARDEKAMREVDEGVMKRAVEAAIKPPKPVYPAPAPASPEDAEAEQTVSFRMNPCTMAFHYPPQVDFFSGVDMPAFFLAGWGDECPPAWTLAERLRGVMTWPPTASSMAAQRGVDACFVFLIALQWILMGAFPLVRNPRWRRWWGEPGTFITVCAVIGGLLMLIYPNTGAARLFALPAMLAWFWWFGLLAWRPLSGTWRLVLRKQTAAN
jgi:hypothetical protein